MVASAAAISELFPAATVGVGPRAAPIERLWMVSSSKESKEQVVKRLLHDTVLLSVDDGSRLVGPQDHIAVFDSESRTILLLGPGPPQSASYDLVPDLLEVFAARPLGLAVTPILALSFRGGRPAARLGEERTTVTTALHHSMDPRSAVGRGRASGMALHTLEEMDDALVGVFERERASVSGLDASRAVSFCQRAREAFWRAGLERPRRSTEGEVRKLWAYLQSAFPFVQPLPPEPPRRLGYAADMLLGARVDVRSRNAPFEMRIHQPRRILGAADRALMVQALPAAHHLDDVLTPIIRTVAAPGGGGDGLIRVEAMLESELFVRLGVPGRNGPRGPKCVILAQVEGGHVVQRAPAARLGEWSPLTVLPHHDGNVCITVKFSAPGLDMVSASLTLKASAM